MSSVSYIQEIKTILHEEHVVIHIITLTFISAVIINDTKTHIGFLIILYTNNYANKSLWMGLSPESPRAISPPKQRVVRTEMAPGSGSSDE